MAMAGEASTSGRGGLGERVQSYLDKTRNGEGMVYYPSGQVAAVVAKQGLGRIVTLFSDSPNSTILVNFDVDGVGGANYPNGKPWLVVTPSSYSLSDRKGNIVERGKFPRTSQEELRLEVTECITVRFLSRQAITVAFSAGDCQLEWACGETPRRAEGPYTAKVLGRLPDGRLELDVGSIRQRQAAIGSVYVPAGPHAKETDRPGLGSLRRALRSLDPACAVASTVEGLRSLDCRLSCIEVLPKPVLYGTSRSASANNLLGSGAAGSPAATLGPNGKWTLDDYGAPPLSAAQRRFASTMRSVDYSGRGKAYKAKRLKLPWMRLPDVQQQVYGDPLPDTLMMLVVLADWNPVCRTVEAVAEAANGQLREEAASKSGGEAAHVKMYRLDASEGNTLQDRYGFRTVPMFLCFYEGRLVAASNNVRAPGDAVALGVGALTRGRKGEFLPEGFRFGPGQDNTLLEYIRPGTILREL
ncbi:hypothetical protein HYH03_008391 [Edaphochlamys debaryana]|uniref:FAM194 C-terminal domain-containing protein n=1 Tax=Edaphochlamys debaryana TaxID=47281 RepID=A0A835Y234_9CHLO|nr:hypothetical protein HYH03_008391 [Edaphochlamys debaryana]|eukprot:KAG2493253.1 hypothetical protein HYH03_008391 [Edaphochlamys debaryana]